MGDEETTKEARLDVRMKPERYEEIKKLARYAAVEGFILDDHRGNVTAFINWCISLGEESLRQHALKKRGF